MNHRHENIPATDAATGDGRPIDAWPPLPEELAAAAIHRAASPAEPMPAELAAAVGDRLSNLIDERHREEHAAAAAPIAFEPRPPARSAFPWFLTAAALVLGAGGVLFVGEKLRERTRELDSTVQQVAMLMSRVEQNETLLAASKTHIDDMKRELAARTGELSERDSRLLAAAAENARLAKDLADTSAVAARQASELGEALLTIARLEAPADPEIARQNRLKMLEVPDTIRVAWAPFNLEGAPAAEQPNIQGDVVWNDRMESGYLRFVGLKPNDPAVEQYQVWVIDERGLEQKVSGGVFNATAEGEVIVPIDPGIAVGRVALFAITVEKPGGTWVPDLKRRVVVAPRS